MNALGFFVFIIAFSGIAIFILLDNRELKSNRFITGEVHSMRMDTIKKRSEARYSIGYKYIPVLTISIGSADFKIKPQYEHYQDELYAKIKKGDYLKIYYRNVPENKYMPVHIEREGEVLFPFSFFYNIRNDVLKVVIPIFLVFIISTIILIVKRRKIA